MAEPVWKGREDFERLVQQLGRETPPSQERVVAVAKAALREPLFYKHAVHVLEKALARARPPQLLGLAYAMDALVRRSQALAGRHK